MPIDLKDTKSVTAATDAFEKLKAAAIDLGFRILAETSSFGNADWNDEPAASNAPADEE